MKALNMVPEAQYGYYSTHGVCISNLYPDKNVDYSWGYTAFVMILNFLIFVCISVAYVLIYRFDIENLIECLKNAIIFILDLP